MSKIIAIEFENFQSIKERTRINLGSITLLYGPNSAGKSSVFDALELIECIWDPIKFESPKVQAMVKKWSRIENHKSLPLSLAIEYELDEQGSHPYDDVWDDDNNWNCLKPRTPHQSFYYGAYTDDPLESPMFENGPAKVRLEIEFVYERKYLRKHVISAIQIIVNEKIILSYGKKYPIRESLGYELKNHEEQLAREDFLAINSKVDFHNTNLPFLIDDIKHRPKDAQHLVKINNEEYYWSFYSINEFDITSFVGGAPDSDRSVDAILALNASDLTFYFGTLLGKILRNKSPLVKADRRVPTPQEALTIVDPGIANWWGTSNFSPSTPAKLISESSKNIDPHYSIVARSAHAELLKRTTTADFWGGSFAEEQLASFCKESELVDRINHHLESRLFREKLYKVKCSSTLMVPIDLNEDDPWDYYSLAQPATVRLFLEDGESRKTEFEDVGSGVPFVLPVLCAAVVGGLAKIQQPELHLHPALQSSIADVLIEEKIANSKNQFIIETHSEHLLLRLLRRIRDTENKVSTATDLPLKSEDIAVYYFDPQVNGGTIVTRQLVTPLGDFYNDWPKGFFAERDGDLFNV